MPFLVSSNQPAIRSITLQTGGINWPDLARYRENLEKRVDSVRQTNGLDHTDDLRAIQLSTDALKKLVANAADGDYLVAQYYCEPKEKLYKNLNVALCIKRKQATGDVIVDDLVIDTMGNRITDYKSIFQNYRDRRQEIWDSKKTNEFDADKEGRAHLIDINLRNTIGLLSAATDVAYLYFILDEDGPANQKKNLSVVLADRKFENQQNSPIAYDHGTQCCPLN